MYRDDKIRGKQAELGLSVDEVAERAGVNVNTVSAVRNGKSVKAETLEKVASALGLTMAEVFEPRPEAEAVTTS
jgi:transcriptional regulator with XRE-family HTH domain